MKFTNAYDRARKMWDKRWRAFNIQGPNIPANEVGRINKCGLPTGKYKTVPTKVWWMLLCMDYGKEGE